MNSSHDRRMRYSPGAHPDDYIYSHRCKGNAIPLSEALWERWGDFCTIHSLCLAILRKFQGISNDSILTDARQFFYERLRNEREINDKENFIKRWHCQTWKSGNYSTILWKTGLQKRPRRTLEESTGSALYLRPAMRIRSRKCLSGSTGTNWGKEVCRRTKAPGHEKGQQVRNRIPGKRMHFSVVG